MSQEHGSDINPCASCKVRYMAKYSCCTEDVGYGLKPVRAEGHVVMVCEQLVKNPETNRFQCGIYNDPTRPDECKSFESARYRRIKGTDGDDDNDIGSNIWDL